MTNYKVIVAYITKHSTENAEKVHTQITQGLGPKPSIVCNPDYTCKSQRDSETAQITAGAGIRSKITYQRHQAQATPPRVNSSN